MSEILKERRTSMNKQILTLDNLYQFFVEQNKTVSFNAKESGKPIVVRTDGFFEEDSIDMPGMLKLKLKVCHTLTNRNGSHISDENMEKAMPTLKYRPILAYIHELDDGTKDFYAHNMEIVEDENGEQRVNYIEKQVGCFTADEPWLEYDKSMDKTYVMAYAVIPEEYTDAADIIRRKNGTKVSCELVINDLAYNAKEKYLDLTDFYFGGCTLLGKDENGINIEEGMEGARGDIVDFCHDAPVFTYQNKLIETLEKLNITLSDCNKNSEEGGDEEMDNFKDEVFEEVVETEVDEAIIEVEDTEVVEETETEEASVSEDVDDVQVEFEEVSVDENFTKTFTVELSHEDINCALYNLIVAYEDEDNEYYYIRNVYDNYFIMHGWYNNKLYKVGYSISGENVSLDGERQEVFELIVTESEKIAIEKMRENYVVLESAYNELKAFKENYDATILKAEKDAIFESAEYNEIRDTEEFKQLMSDAENYTVDEIKTKADLLFASDMKKKFNFSANTAEKQKSVGLNIKAKPNKKAQAYAGLFND
jgi:hypothetical protein